MKSLLKEKILHSGIIFTALSLISGVGNLVFLRLNASALKDPGEFGAFGQTTTFVGLLGLPLLMASTAIVHHIAHFRGENNEARLRGLLAGCRSFLLKLTIVGSILGLLLIKPLSLAFNIPRPSLTMAALVSLIVALWGGYASALAQGMGWFKRLALISLAIVVVKIIFIAVVARKYPVAESSVLAVAAGTLVTMAVFFWWRDLFTPGERISPWDRDFFRYLIVAAAGVGAQWCFTQSDMQVVGNFFGHADKDAYYGAVRIASALHLAVSPLLIVLFTARSGERAGKVLAGPLGLLLLYAVGLAVGATVLFFTRGFCVSLVFSRPFPQAVAMIGPLAVTMIFVGLTQALGMWALASHWLKVGILYGVLGAAYWAILLGSASRATPPIAHTVVPNANATAYIISFQPTEAASYRILHQGADDKRFTEVTNIAETTFAFDPGTNGLAGTHQFKVVPVLPPTILLRIMPVAAAVGFVIMFVAWLSALRKSRAGAATT